MKGWIRKFPSMKVGLMNRCTFQEKRCLRAAEKSMQGSVKNINQCHHTRKSDDAAQSSNANCYLDRDAYQVDGLRTLVGATTFPKAAPNFLQAQTPFCKIITSFRARIADKINRILVIFPRQQECLDS